jgi:chemotaxis signal transduction protein
VTESQLAFAVAEAPDDTRDALVGTEAIVVRLGAGRFAVDMASVAEVGRAPAVSRVPGVPAWLSGVANWRGRILPVLDLRTLLGADGGDPHEHSRLLVLASGSIVVGMLVDSVDGTTTLTEIADFPATSTVGSSALVCGQVPREDGPIAVLSVEGMLRLREQLPKGRRSA